jgi:hypothetical protein
MHPIDWTIVVAFTGDFQGIQDIWEFPFFLIKVDVHYRTDYLGDFTDVRHVIFLG